MHSKFFSKKIFALIFSIVFLVGLSQPLISVRAASTDISPYDLSISDLGANLIFNFPNVTYTTDGTGADLDTFLKIVPQVHSIQNVRLVVSATGDQKATISPNGVVSANFKGMVTNQTANDEFEFDFQTIEDLGKFDFGSAIDSTTEYNTTIPLTSAVAINVTSDYVQLNKSLSNLAKDFSTKDNYFDGITNRVSNGNYETIIVGYDDFEQGVLGDLKLYLAFILEKDAADIRIQEYNLTSVHLAYNMSNGLTTWIKDVVDRSITKAGLETSLKLQGTSYKTTTHGGSASWVKQVLEGASRGTNSMSVTFGTPLAGFKRSGSVLSASTVATVANEFINPLGAVLKSVLSGDPSNNAPQYDISTKIGTGVNKMSNDPIAATLTALTGLSADITQYWWIIPIVLIVILLLIYFRRRRMAGKKTLFFF